MSQRSPTAELRTWVQEQLNLDPVLTAELIRRVDEVVSGQRALSEESKLDAIRALSEGFTENLEKLERQLSDRDVTVSNIARYFEDVVADLTDKSHRDPKTKLLNYSWFMERIESFLAIEQRVRWCGVGVVDISSFKWYNDTLGHAIGDRIIEGVARILSDSIRSHDYLAREQGADSRDLHARFGGDEFCFLIPICLAASRRSRSPDASRARGEPPLVTRRSAACLAPGSSGRRRRVCAWCRAERRGFARQLADDLIKRADALMYDAKERKSAHVHCTAVAVSNGLLIDIPEIDAHQLTPCW